MKVRGSIAYFGAFYSTPLKSILVRMDLQLGLGE
jgi:hypothetical protein